jgi:hypothetical protein
VLSVLSTALFLKDIALAIENYKSCTTFLNNIDALNLAGTIDRSVGKSDGLLSEHAMVSVNRRDLTQRWPNKQNRIKWLQTAMKRKSMSSNIFRYVSNFVRKSFLLQVKA